MWRPSSGKSNLFEPYELYDAVAAEACELVIGRYSTSFGIASRILEEPVRSQVRTIYALVRVADELVDAPRPGGTDDLRRVLLDSLEAEVERAVETGHSANLIVHAYAQTARRCGIGRDLTGPFFESMRLDLTKQHFDDDLFAAYIHGSAEVVGLMCLRAFVLETPDPQQLYDQLYDGAARLGAAFQKVNFVRDFASDTGTLGRHYFPGVQADDFDESTKHRLLDDIDADLEAAQVAIRELPSSSRRAVQAAHGLFAALSSRLRSTSATEICQNRVSVPTLSKAIAVGRSVWSSR